MNTITGFFLGFCLGCMGLLWNGMSGWLIGLLCGFIIVTIDLIQDVILGETA